jgi:acylphosphatase
MIARKIIYRGKFNEEIVGTMFDITRKNEISGVIKRINDSQVEIDLEGDPSMIKLIQHQIERKIKSSISEKQIEQIPYQYFSGVTYIP